MKLRFHSSVAEFNISAELGTYMAYTMDPNLFFNAWNENSQEREWINYTELETQYQILRAGFGSREAIMDAVLIKLEIVRVYSAQDKD